MINLRFTDGILGGIFEYGKKSDDRKEEKRKNTIRMSATAT
jgi:hypothetical protein